MKTTRLVTVNDAPGLWGAENYLLRLAPFIADAGYDQLLAAPPCELADAWVEAGYEWIALPMANSRALGTGVSRRILELSKQVVPVVHRGRLIAQIIRDRSAQLVQGNSFWTLPDAALAGRIARVPCILHLHGNEGGMARLTKSVSVLASSRSIAVSDAVARSLLPIARRRTQTIVNGVDTSVFYPAPPAPGVRALLAHDEAGVVALVACRLDRAKQLEHVIHAVKRVRDRGINLQLAVVGATTETSSYEDFLRDLGESVLGEAVRFLGRRSDVESLLRAADIYVLAGSVEGLPLGIIEAQASGCAVVAYPASGIPEVVVHGITGLLAIQNDWVSLSEKLFALASNPQFRSEVSRRALESVHLRTLERQAAAYLELLETVLSLCVLD